MINETGNLCRQEMCETCLNSKKEDLRKSAGEVIADAAFLRDLGGEIIMKYKEIM